ncbi:NAD(P)/FAD-dependent oxidoreductase [Streptosporangium sp. NPDC023615]|uniref:NAD(P)/FAD-dependent oxidoreductase n=1 Tax=Streptosporangium sp. NPDC023615 TaxID=3154794 RepID=UPI003443B096
MPDTVIVVGAGLAGLACALRLRSAGMDVRVLDAAAEVGGRVRTDVVDGFRLDHGFQVFNTAYPEAARVLDLGALDLRAIPSGVISFDRGRRERLMLPWRHPSQAFSGVLADVGTPVDKAVLAALTTRDIVLPASRLRAGRERTTLEELKHWGVSPKMVEKLIRPFLAGVLLERELETSSRFFHLIWRCFARGTIAVPALGMGEITRQLASRLPAETITLETPVIAVTEEGVETAQGGTIPARAVVVATDPAMAAALHPGLEIPAMRSVTTFYHAASRPPTEDATQFVDVQGEITDTLVISNTAPAYAPPGRALISTSVLGMLTDADEPRVRARLAQIYDIDASGWEHLATYAVEGALPAMTPPFSLRSPVRLGPGRYVCGDHRDTGSQQGALVSGRRAADAVLAERR